MNELRMMDAVLNVIPQESRQGVELRKEAQRARQDLEAVAAMCMQDRRLRNSVGMATTGMEDGFSQGTPQ